MTPEGIQHNTNKVERGSMSKAGEDEQVSDYREEKAAEEKKAVGQEYEEKQQKLFSLQENLQRSVNDAIAQPERKKLLTLIGKSIQSDITKTQEELAKLTAKLKELGGMQ